MKRFFVVLTLLLLIVQCGCSVRYDETNIETLYSREWILGKTRTEIQQKYGSFDREYILDSGEDVGAYKVNSYDGTWLDPNNISDTYFVVFEEDVAVDAYFRETSKGG